ncbi:MAG: hypothetical protein LBJ42_01240 [Holosporales bacterium]|jgi:hypothetical protein|nr:hypothetical protein [Holosporales bacterium]
MSLDNKQNDKRENGRRHDDTSSPNDSDFSGGVDRKLLTNCVLSVAVAMVVTFVTMKVAMNYHDDKIRELIESHSALEDKVRAVSEATTDAASSLSAIQAEMKADKETVTQACVAIKSIQDEIKSVKEMMSVTHNHPQNVPTIEDSPKENRKKALRKKEFLEQLERNKNEGSPFDKDLKALAQQYDITKCKKSYERVLELSKKSVETKVALAERCERVGAVVFKIAGMDESFWEKQGRLIREKIVGAINLGKENTEEDDKTLIRKARYQLTGDIAGALATLEKVKTKHDAIATLTERTRERAQLDEAFAIFKEEFIGKRDDGNS